MSKQKKRWPDYIYGVGEEPDPRASLANERTALAGLRTALALIATSLAIAAVLHYTESSPFTLKIIGVCLSISGSLLAITSLAHWINVERALRNKKPMPSPNGLVTVTLVVSVLGVVTILSILS